jgi:hypothetical protein
MYYNISQNTFRSTKTWSCTYQLKYHNHLLSTFVGLKVGLSTTRGVTGMQFTEKLRSLPSSQLCWQPKGPHKHIAWPSGLELYPFGMILISQEESKTIIRSAGKRMSRNPKFISFNFYRLGKVNGIQTVTRDERFLHKIICTCTSDTLPSQPFHCIMIRTTRFLDEISVWKEWFDVSLETWSRKRQQPARAQTSLEPPFCPCQPPSTMSLFAHVVTFLQGTLAPDRHEKHTVRLYLCKFEFIHICRSINPQEKT